MRFETEQIIERSADDVWSYAADIGRHPEWMSVTDATVTAGDGEHVGSKGRERVALGPIHYDMDFEVETAEPARRIRWRSLGGAPFDLAVQLDLAATGPSTTSATYRAEVRLRGLWRLAAPLLALEGREGPARELRRMKDVLEASAAIEPAQP